MTKSRSFIVISKAWITEIDERTEEFARACLWEFVKVTSSPEQQFMSNVMDSCGSDCDYSVSDPIDEVNEATTRGAKVVVSGWCYDWYRFEPRRIVNFIEALQVWPLVNEDNPAGKDDFRDEGHQFPTCFVN
jgi:hypothetical protein